MKTVIPYASWKFFLPLVLVSILPLTLTACDSNDNEPEEYLEVDRNGYTRFSQALLADMIAAMPAQALSDSERVGIYLMREEEKLAHDVYEVLYQKWGRQVFDNISRSEQTHTDAMLLLIQKYELDDPAANTGVGEFNNAMLQKLYDSLVSSGIVSSLEALKVGAAIEEIDILDLQRQLEFHVDNQDITLVYENLLKGSRNHLRAFVRNMNQSGITYTPQFLREAAYLEIINAPMERGSVL